MVGHAERQGLTQAKQVSQGTTTTKQTRLVVKEQWFVRVFVCHKHMVDHAVWVRI